MDIVAPWQFTPMRAGYYLLTASCRWALAVGEGGLINFRINGGVYVSEMDNDASAVSAPTTDTMMVYYLTPNDFVEVIASFDQIGPAVNRSIMGNITNTHFMGHRLS